MQVKNNYKLEWKITNAKGFSVEEGLEYSTRYGV